MDFLYIKETPWHNMGYVPEAPPSTTEELVQAAHMDWTVSAHPMFTKEHGHIDKWHAIVRDDAEVGGVLGVINKEPVITQNIDAFSIVNSILNNGLTVETAGVAMGGQITFASFKVNESYKLLDDDIDHYFLVMNEHLKPDGAVTVCHTPVRVVCQNVLTAAISKSLYSMRLFVSNVPGSREASAQRVLESVGSAMHNMSQRAEKMATKKVTTQGIDLLLSELFPLMDETEGDSHAKANERMIMAREMFISECMGADNLANYRGTMYQVYNAAVDWSQHVFSRTTTAYDTTARMKSIPGFGSDGTSSIVAKVLRMEKQLIS